MREMLPDKSSLASEAFVPTELRLPSPSQTRAAGAGREMTENPTTGSQPTKGALFLTGSGVQPNTQQIAYVPDTAVHHRERSRWKPGKPAKQSHTTKAPRIEQSLKPQSVKASQISHAKPKPGDRL